MADKKRPDPDTEYAPPKEIFEVVLIKNGASVLTCKSEDLKRVTVESTDPLAAMMSDEATKVEGYSVVQATKPDVMIEAEIMAKRRELEGDLSDRSKW